MKIKPPHPVALKNQALVQTKTLYYMIKRSLEVKLPTLSTDGKAEVGRIREEKRRSEKRKSHRKEDAGARKCRKYAIHWFFSNDLSLPEGRKVGSLKWRVRSHLAR